MLFENKFNLTEELKKANSKNEVYEMAFNTFCVKYVKTMINNGFILNSEKTLNSAYFAMELPVKKAIKNKPDKFNQLYKGVDL